MAWVFYIGHHHTTPRPIASPQMTCDNFVCVLCEFFSPSPTLSPPARHHCDGCTYSDRSTLNALTPALNRHSTPRDTKVRASLLPTHLPLGVRGVFFSSVLFLHARMLFSCGSPSSPPRHRCARFLSLAGHMRSVSRSSVRALASERHACPCVRSVPASTVTLDCLMRSLKLTTSLPPTLTVWSTPDAPPTSVCQPVRRLNPRHAQPDVLPDAERHPTPR